MRWERDGVELDDDRTRLASHFERITAWLAASYWAGQTPPDRVRRSWERAGIVAGLYDGDELIGCARVVTDFARVAYLSDVYVVPERRGEGLGGWVVESLLAHPEIGPVRWMLHTSSAHTLYARYGFERADETTMQRPRPA